MRSASARSMRTADTAHAAHGGRGIVAAVVSTSIALLAHVLAGGALPAAPGIIATSVLALVACLALAPLRHSRVRLVLSVTASQLLFHALFSLAAHGPHAAHPAPTPTGPHLAVSHAHHGAHGVPGTEALAPDTVAPVADAVAQAEHSAVTMTLAHLIAGAVTYVALRRGEVVLDRISSATSTFATRLLPPALTAQLPPARPHRALASAAGTWIPTFLAQIASSPVRRGPPALVLA